MFSYVFIMPFDHIYLPLPFLPLVPYLFPDSLPFYFHAI
jgi:hypothetical protein